MLLWERNVQTDANVDDDLSADFGQARTTLGVVRIEALPTPFCERLDFYEARKFCEGSGGYLVSIADAGEQEFVNGLLYGSLDIQESWIGYYRSKYRGPFEWVDKSPSTFEKWTMELSGDWADLNCYAKKTFICERESCRDLPN
ncbi:lectin C-type domain protein [Ancylostoma ceylanicum]|uniref:Lectin C-type domain protein n=1 Tax=Ancylostoma ceylanicum TaxID=53326 RepID=A0A0D6LAQ1_9BILA|nr:lectin C-type domain protein [Ancylostoma ceylanicum]